jgi:site-specific DNA-methyltransferase (adenine-specific)
MNHRAAPGIVRDSIIGYLSAAESASVAEITQAVASRVGYVPSSSVRSYLNLNTPDLFQRTSRGHYRLRGLGDRGQKPGALSATSLIGQSWYKPIVSNGSARARRTRSRPS